MNTLGFKQSLCGRAAKGFTRTGQLALMWWLVSMGVENTAEAQPAVNTLQPRPPFQDPGKLVANAQKPFVLHASKGSVAIPGFGNIHGLYMFSVNQDKPSLLPRKLRVKPGGELLFTMENHLCDNGTPSADPNLQNVNVHTHGLLVSPHERNPQVANDRFGDFSLLSIGCPNNGLTTANMSTASGHSSHAGHSAAASAPNSAAAASVSEAMSSLPVLAGSANYRIRIPKDHPSGLFWYHPHIHGVANTQVGGGMSGLLEVGQLNDYAPVDLQKTAQHYLMLKDVQIKRSAIAPDASNWDYEPLFKKGDCRSLGLNSSVPLLKGSVILPAKDSAAAFVNRSESIDFAPGLCSFTADKSGEASEWLFTVNGQWLPRLAIGGNTNMVLRLANVSANVTHLLALVVEDAKVTAKNPHPRLIALPFQVISKDGVSQAFNPPRNHVVLSRGARTPNRQVLPTANRPEFVISHSAFMMPASRLEMYISKREICKKLKAYRADAACRSGGVNATLVQLGYGTGMNGAGDNWPAVQLAKIHFDVDRNNGVASKGYLTVKANFGKNSSSSTEDQTKMLKVKQPSQDTGVVAGSTCNTQTAVSLLPNQYRVVDFRNGSCENWKDGPGCPVIEESFAMRSLVLDASQPGKDIGSSMRDTSLADSDGYKLFNHANANTPDICVGAALSQANQAYKETWIVRNQSDEIHNFHIHQLKFAVVDIFDSAATSNPQAQRIQTKQAEAKVQEQIQNTRTRLATQNQTVAELHDTFPVPPHGSIKVEMTFDRPEQAGRYVYHCHILEHEDAGMMSVIQVVDISK